MSRFLFLPWKLKLVMWLCRIRSGIICAWYACCTSQTHTIVFIQPDRHVQVDTFIILAMNFTYLGYNEELFQSIKIHLPFIKSWRTKTLTFLFNIVRWKIIYTEKTKGSLCMGKILFQPKSSCLSLKMKGNRNRIYRLPVCLLIHRKLH